jgi:hypothetical protein
MASNPFQLSRLPQSRIASATQLLIMIFDSKYTLVVSSSIVNRAVI